MFTLYRIAFNYVHTSYRHEKRAVIVWAATEWNWNKSFTHIERRTVGREGLVSLNPGPHYWIVTSVSADSSPSSYLFTAATIRIPFTLHQCVAQNISDMCLSTVEISAAQLHYVTDIVPKSPFSICELEALSGIVWNSLRNPYYLKRSEHSRRLRQNVAY